MLSFVAASLQRVRPLDELIAARPELQFLRGGVPHELRSLRGTGDSGRGLRNWGGLLSFRSSLPLPYASPPKGGRRRRGAAVGTGRVDGAVGGHPVWMVGLNLHGYLAEVDRRHDGHLRADNSISPNAPMTARYGNATANAAI